MATHNSRQSERKFRLWFIQAGITLALFALALIAILMIGSFLFVQKQTAIETQVKQKFSEKAEELDNHLTHWLNERKLDAQTLANRDEIKSLDSVTAEKAIRPFFEQSKIYEDVWIARADGSLLYDYNKATGSVANRDFFKWAIQGKTSASGPSQSGSKGPIVVTFTTPIQVKNKVVGILGLTVPTQTLTLLLQEGWIGASGDAYLINSAGVFLTGSRFTQVFKEEGSIKEHTELELVNLSKTAQEVLEGNSGVKQYQNIFGNPVLGAYRPLKSQPWGLLIEQNTDEAFAELIQLCQTAFGVAAGLILLALILSIFLGFMVTHIIKSKINAAHLSKTVN